MKKYILWTIGSIFFLAFLTVIIIFSFGKKTKTVVIDDKEISVSSTKTETDEPLISANEIFDATDTAHSVENGVIYAKGKKLLEIDENSASVRIDGELYPVEIQKKDGDIMISPYLAGEILNYQTVISDNKIHFINPVSVSLGLRDGKKDIEFKYSDSLFLPDSGNYNHSLAQLSIGLAVSAFSSKSAGGHWGDDGDFGREADVKKFYEDMGFSNIKCYNYDKSLNSTEDSVAFALASKKIENNNKSYNLVALSIRGGAYGNEWVSNFNLGNTEIHKGFLLSSNEVVKTVYEYMGEDTTNTKLWITGYSRGGGVAGITAARLTDEGRIKPENIYAYTFAAPRGTMSKTAKSEKYDHIFNILSDIDIVPLIAPQGWGYRRYGTDVFLPTLLDFSDETALAQSNKISGLYREISNSGDFNLMKTEQSGQKKETHSLIDGICTALGSRISYTDKYDDIIMDFIECSNMKIKDKNGNWKTASPDECLALKYSDAKDIIATVKGNEFFKNAESILGDSGKKLLVFASLCIIHGENPYDIIVNKIGISSLTTLASVFSDTSAGGVDMAKAHFPESYISQLLSIAEPTLMRINQ